MKKAKDDLEDDPIVQRARKAHGDEKFKAEERIQALSREKSERVIHWAIGFASRDFASLSQGQLSDLRYEMDYFARFSGRPTFPTGKVPFPSAHGLLPWSMSDKSDVKTVTFTDDMAQEIPSPAIMVELHRRTKMHLENLLAGKKTELTLTQGTKEVLNYFATKKQIEVDFSFYSDPQTAYEHSLLSALAQHPSRLRRCPGCNVIFFTERKNQAYHTSACRGRHYMRLKRGTPPERFGKRGRKKRSTAKTRMNTLRLKKPVSAKKLKGKGGRHGQKRR